jgi:predicted Zn-dependent peptidase
LKHDAPNLGGDADTTVATLPNGVRVVAIRRPYLSTVAVSVFVRTGSCHEDARRSGISHVIEHMAFKGTRTRDCQAINLDAERLGAEVNAHTDKDHTAFHMRGLARDAGAFIAMLGDIVLGSTFPDDELARERAVILQEMREGEDDPMAVAFECFDVACYRDHPAGRAVIGRRANIRRFARDELVAWVRQQYTGANTIVGVAGDIDVDGVVAGARAAFGAMRRGTANRIEPPVFIGGVRQRRFPESGQAHVVLGFPIAVLADAHLPYVVAAALLGEGMSSPLLDELRERRGLVYHADCWTDLRDAYGQWVIEASTPGARLGDYASALRRIVQAGSAVIDAVGLERARNQIAVRWLSDCESPAQRLEMAARDLFTLGRVRSTAEFSAGLAAVDASAVRDAFARMLATPPAIGVAGDLDRSDARRLAGALRFD